MLQWCTSPRQAWDALLAWYGPHTDGAKSGLSRCLNSFKIVPGSDPLEEMDRIEDPAAEMRTAGLALDQHMLYTMVIDALPAEYEVDAGTWHLATASAARISSRLCEFGITDFLETGRRNRALGMPCTTATAPVAATGKVKAAATAKADVGEGTDEALEAPTRSVVARPRMPVAMAAAPKPSKVVLQ